MRARATAILAVAAMVACGGSTGPSGAGSSSAPAPSAPDAGPAPAPGPAPDAGPQTPPPPAPPAQPLAYSVTDLGKGFANFVDALGRVAGSTCDDTSCSGGVYSAPGGWS